MDNVVPQTAVWGKTGCFAKANNPAQSQGMAHLHSVLQVVRLHENDGPFQLSDLRSIIKYFNCAVSPYRLEKHRDSQQKTL